MSIPFGDICGWHAYDSLPTRAHCSYAIVCGVSKAHWLHEQPVTGFTMREGDEFRWSVLLTMDDPPMTSLHSSRSREAFVTPHVVGCTR